MACVVALEKGCTLERITCPKCLHPHLDEGVYATKAHVVHRCNACGRQWRRSGLPVQGNPLAAFAPELVNGSLVLNTEPMLAPGWTGSPTGVLGALREGPVD